MRTIDCLWRETKIHMFYCMECDILRVRANWGISYIKILLWRETPPLMLPTSGFLSNRQIMNENLWMRTHVFIGKILVRFESKNRICSEQRVPRGSKQGAFSFLFNMVGAPNTNVGACWGAFQVIRQNT